MYDSESVDKAPQAKYDKVMSPRDEASVDISTSLSPICTIY